MDLLSTVLLIKNVDSVWYLLAYIFSFHVNISDYSHS